MTLNAQTILTMSEDQIKPVQWFVLQSPDLTYTLRATKLQPIDDKFFPVITARGQTKCYKTMKAVMHDIRKVDNNPLVQFHLEEA